MYNFSVRAIVHRLTLEGREPKENGSIFLFLFLYKLFQIPWKDDMNINVAHNKYLFHFEIFLGGHTSNIVALLQQIESRVIGRK